MSNKIYIVAYTTESGDEGVDGYWIGKPSDKNLETYFRKKCPNEFDNKRKVRYIFWSVHELESQKMPKEAKKVTPTI